MSPSERCTVGIIVSQCCKIGPRRGVEMKSSSLAVLVLMTLVAFAGDACGFGFEPPSVHSMMRTVGINFGQGYHSYPKDPLRRPAYGRAQRPHGPVVPPPTYPCSSRAPEPYRQCQHFVPPTVAPSMMSVHANLPWAASQPPVQSMAAPMPMPVDTGNALSIQSPANAARSVVDRMSIPQPKAPVGPTAPFVEPRADQPLINSVEEPLPPAFAPSTRSEEDSATRAVETVVPGTGAPTSDGNAGEAGDGALAREALPLPSTGTSRPSGSAMLNELESYFRGDVQSGPSHRTEMHRLPHLGSGVSISTP